MSFTVAFAGARDSYQVPLALHESMMLSSLVTDFYCPFARLPLPGSFTQKLAARQNPGLPSSKVKVTIPAIHRTFILPALQRYMGRSPAPRATAGDAQNLISLAALRSAEESDSHLFLYAGYAYEAFRSPRSNRMTKALFMYHPHIRLSSEILLKDCNLHPALASSRFSIQEDLKDETNDIELRLADLIVCASTFTAQSLRHIGIPDHKIRVVPYGIDFGYVSMPYDDRSRSELCEFLFVGSGIHRKGLHHLLQAWKIAAISHARLTIVARYMESDIKRLLDAPNVRYIAGTTKSGINDLYRTSDVFVMPSLIEGFGYVYLEALAHGCFCIGTENTGLPDLDMPDFAAQSCEAGNVGELTHSLLCAAKRCRSRQFDRAQIMKSVEVHSWKRFRLRISEVCRALITTTCAP